MPPLPPPPPPLVPLPLVPLPIVPLYASLELTEEAFLRCPMLPMLPGDRGDAMALDAMALDPLDRFDEDWGDEDRGDVWLSGEATPSTPCSL